jgi:hypothetical protein
MPSGFPLKMKAKAGIDLNKKSKPESSQDMKPCLPFVRFLLPLLMLSAATALAAGPGRVLSLTGPSVVRPGSDIQVMVTASTDATDGEEIWFFHAEFSTDNGKSWTPVYSEKLGRSASRPVNFKVGADGTTALVRARIAFRGGKAGDVDYSGGPIVWDGSWGKWATPPAKAVSITVTTK